MSYKARVATRLLCLLTALSFSSAGFAAPDCNKQAWPLWDQFKTHFIQSDGRVLDASTPKMHSSSEGQSYAMFFALVANDPETFEKLWVWSVANLADGNIKTSLPAWIWGKGDDGMWGVLDKNSASDSDLWFAYDLLEAGRIWGRKDYIDDANALLMNIEKQEVTTLPGFGKMLLPGKFGFVRTDNVWQLNPSYLPIPILRRVSDTTQPNPWHEIANNTARMIQAVSKNGFIADWVSYQISKQLPNGAFITDPIKGDIGSYDAIRVYLWSGMTSQKDPLATPIQRSISGMIKATTKNGGVPPEMVNVVTGSIQGNGPFGFSSALIPYFSSSNKSLLLAEQLARARSKQLETLSSQNLNTGQPPYYDYVLSLFGLGWIENRFEFLKNGQINLPLESACR